MIGREKLLLAGAGLLGAAGAALTVLRGYGMRFSGLLLMGVAALILIGAALRRWANMSRVGKRCSRVFRGGCLAVVIILASFEAQIITAGMQDHSAIRADAVIVLGAGVNGTQPSLSLWTRLEAALDYLEEHPDVPVVLTGGQGYGEEISEAQCMYDYLTARGVDADRLILEEQAADTAENLAFSKPLLEQAGVDPETAAVAVVTNDFHIYRACLLAARQGYAYAFGVPAKLPWLHLTVNYYVREAFALVKTLMIH